MFRLSICAETVFRELPFIERAKKISAAGFLVEFWRREKADIEEIARSSIRVGTFSASDQGGIMHPDSAPAFLEGVEHRLQFAQLLSCRELNLLSGSLAETGESTHPIAASPLTRWITAYKTLARVAELAEKNDVVYNLEPLNTKTDHPGYSLSSIEDAVRLLQEVGSPRLKLLFDVYHAQIQEGNVIQLIRDYSPYIGYVHVADVPGRHEPGTGELNYTHIAQALQDVKYDGTIGLEAYPLGSDDEAMERFRTIFAFERRAAQ